MQQVFFLSVLVLTVAVGCSSTKFVRSDFEAKIGSVKPRYEDKDIQKNFEKQINLPKPFSIAVYFKNPDYSHHTKGAWRWDLKEKEEFIKKLRDSTDKSVVKSVFLMNENLEGNTDLYQVRLAASKYGADSVLVVQAAADTVRENTQWAATYALVLPVFFVNGNKAETYFGLSASLWDVRSEFLYLSASAEGTERDVYPALWSKPDSEYIEKTKRMALSNLMNNMGDDFAVLKNFTTNQ
ncbi:MAG: hypothetical protein IT287_07600 [Bdellovibrionaceae bacterium]|nr:hypothetical protein [Pseudobdellovibrionaceae bacterium]